MSGYTAFADFYDSLTANINYADLAEFYVKCFENFGCKPEIVLDLACGTGNLTVELAKRGFDCIGTDASSEMLSSAFFKKNNENILFLKQDADELDLYGTVQCVICNLDSVNHFEPSKILDIFSKVSLFLEKDGLFIFDVNSRYKFETVLADNVFIYDLPDVYCAWSNYYNSDECILDIHLDIFKELDGVYERFDEDFCEYYYSDDYLRHVLDKTGFEVVSTVADFTLDPLTDTTQRIHYITRKRD